MLTLKQQAGCRASEIPALFIPAAFSDLALNEPLKEVSLAGALLRNEYEPAMCCSPLDLLRNIQTFVSKFQPPMAPVNELLDWTATVRHTAVKLAP